MGKNSIEINDGTKGARGMTLASSNSINVKSLIYVVRGQQIMLDSDLALFCDVETRVFNQAVKRN